MTQPPIHDPKGLIRDAFAIDGIGAPECRSIFLDWALGIPPGHDIQTEVQTLLDYYGPTQPTEHPMMQTLQAALQDTGPARRRGGRQGRFAD